MIGSSIFLMKCCLLKRSGDQVSYLALLEGLQQFSGSPVMHVRFKNEVVLQGKRRAFLVDSESADLIKTDMEALGNRVHCDRIYVFIFDDAEELFDNVLEWCADGVTSHIDELQRIPQDNYPWWMQRMRKEQWKLPRNAEREREILRAQDIGAVLAAPLVLDGVITGFVGMDHNHTARIWHQQEKEELATFIATMESVLVGTVAAT
jgi:hypothetical protein